MYSLSVAKISFSVLFFLIIMTRNGQQKLKIMHRLWPSDTAIVIPSIRAKFDSPKGTGYTMILKFPEESSFLHYLLPLSSKTVSVRIKQVKIGTFLTFVALISPALRGWLVGPGAGHCSMNRWPWDQTGTALPGRSNSINLKISNPYDKYFKGLPFWKLQYVLHRVI